MFYETGHTEKHRYNYYTHIMIPAYFSNVATCAAQILNFFKKETREIQTRNQLPPPDFP